MLYSLKSKAKMIHENVKLYYYFEIYLVIYDGENIQVL